MPRKLIAELILDPSQYIRGLRKATRASDEFVATQRKTLGQVGRGVGGKTGALGAIGGGFLGGGAAVGAGILAGEITQGIEVSINAASDLAEQMSKTNVVFGQSAKAVEDWSKTTSSAFGISQREALKTASSFGALFAPVGFVGRQAADQSEKLTQLGADLASFYNTDVQQALDAIRSGLVGEERPLRDYGVRLSAARVQQQALVDTGKKHASQLTELDKTMARIKIIFQDTKNAQGDYARTSEGLANQTRTLKANLDDLSTSLGKTLVPALATATGAANDFFKGLRGEGGGTAADVGKGAEQGKNLFERVNNWMPGFLKAQNVFKFAITRVGPQAIPILFWQTIGKVFGDEPRKAVRNIIDDETAMKMRHGIALSKAIAAEAADAARTMKPATIEQINMWFDQAVSRAGFRAGLLTNTDKQIAAYQAVLAKVKARMAVTKDITRYLKLEDESLQLAAQIAGLQAQKAANLKAAADQADANRKAAVAAAKQEHEDWLDFAYEKAQTTKTIRDDVKTARAALAYWRHEAATGKYTVDEARKVLYWEGQLKDALKQSRGANTDVLAGLMQVSSERLAAILAAGTGLSARGRAILGANIAGAEIQPLHVHVNIDGREVGRAVTADQARTGRRTASQTSGRRG